MGAGTASPPGTLFIVATPIGNLEDITLRAVRTLREADLIAAEDTRHTRKLLSHLGIAKPLISYFDHNHQVRGERILSALAEGKSVALVSDAGTPTISDPGYRLVRDAVTRGVRTVPVPGPSAVIAALSASGLPTDSFAFVGFLPPRGAKRREALRELASARMTIVLYESPRRVVGTLSELLEVLGDRETVIARELTKIHETFLRGRLSAIVNGNPLSPLKGEVVILVAPPERDPLPGAEPADVASRLLRLMEEGASLKSAVAAVARESGISRSVVYQTALTLRGGDEA